MTLGVVINLLANNGGGDGVVMALSCGSGDLCMSMSSNGWWTAHNDTNLTLTVVTVCAEASKGGVLVTHGLDVTGGAANPTSKIDPDGGESLVGHG